MICWTGKIDTKLLYMSFLSKNVFPTSGTVTIARVNKFVLTLSLMPNSQGNFRLFFVVVAVQLLLSLLLLLLLFFLSFFLSFFEIFLSFELTHGRINSFPN